MNKFGSFHSRVHRSKLFVAGAESAPAFSCVVVLTERKDNRDQLRQRFSPFVKNLAVLRGRMSAHDRKAAEVAMRVPDDQERLIIATGRYIGEGFDDARLDTARF